MLCNYIQDVHGSCRFSFVAPYLNIGASTRACKPVAVPRRGLEAHHELAVYQAPVSTSAWITTGGGRSSTDNGGGDSVDQGAGWRDISLHCAVPNQYALSPLPGAAGRRCCGCCYCGRGCGMPMCFVTFCQESMRLVLLIRVVTCIVLTVVDRH